MARSGRLIFDITDMIRLAHQDWQVTGVARVSLTLASQALALRPDVVRIGYFDAVTKSYRALRNPGQLVDVSDLRAHLKRSTGFVRQLKVWKHRESSLRLGYHRVSRELMLAGERCKQLLWRRRLADPQFVFEAGDRVVFLGGGWGALDAFAHLSRAMDNRSPEIEIVTLIHDIIPLVKPSWPGTVDRRLFTHWLRQMLAINASFLFYSRSTQNDFQGWCERQGVERIKARRFRLGDELILSGGGVVRDEVRRLIGAPFLLCVGSVAGRKNGANLIRALRMVQDRCKDAPMPSLVLAGSTTRAELDRILDGEAGFDRVILINKPNDTELATLYRNCRFTVFPSLYEGWGLPIGESLWHGKVCATSNRSSMPEVGGDLCDYFDPDDPADIARTLERLICDPNYLAERTASIDRRRLRTWRESAEGLLERLTEAPRAISAQVGAG